MKNKIEDKEAYIAPFSYEPGCYYTMVWDFITNMKGTVYDYDLILNAFRDYHKKHTMLSFIQMFHLMFKFFPILNMV